MVDFHMMNLSPSVKICEIWNLLKVSDIDKQFEQNIKFSSCVMQEIKKIVFVLVILITRTRTNFTNFTDY